jgi:hypothetical protein
MLYQQVAPLELQERWESLLLYTGRLNEAETMKNSFIFAVIFHSRQAFFADESAA